MNNLLNYGIDENLSSKVLDLGLNITSIRATSKKNLAEKYGLTEREISILKQRIHRRPIDDEVLEKLLINNAFTCCVCQGVKSDAYIIHHIEHYNLSQDNSYGNLAVLCPNDHELAHREGEALAKKISAKQIRVAKRSWEKKIISRQILEKTLEKDIRELDYVNIPRIMELCYYLFPQIPVTRFTTQLLQIGLIQKNGMINPEYYEKKNLNINTPLRFFAMFGSTALMLHYFHILVECFNKLEVHDLDNLLNKKEIKAGIIGRFCYYAGGVYGKMPRGEITKNSEPTTIHFRRKPFFIEWAVDPMYITSSTATGRIARRPVYLIYGKILNVLEIDEENRKGILVQIRPYGFGITPIQKDRKPEIHYKNMSQNFDNYFESE